MTICRRSLESWIKYLICRKVFICIWSTYMCFTTKDVQGWRSVIFYAPWWTIFLFTSIFNPQKSLPKIPPDGFQAEFILTTRCVCISDNFQSKQERNWDSKCKRNAAIVTWRRIESWAFLKLLLRYVNWVAFWDWSIGTAQNSYLHMLKCNANAPSVNSA